MWGTGQTHPIKFARIQLNSNYFTFLLPFIIHFYMCTTIITCYLRESMNNTFSFFKCESSKGSPFKANKGNPGESLIGNGGGCVGWEARTKGRLLSYFIARHLFI